MPALRGENIPPGPWANPARRLPGPRSKRRCPGCGQERHALLDEIGDTYHATCDPNPPRKDQR